MSDAQSSPKGSTAETGVAYRLLRRAMERLIELLIRVCGISCVILVFGIFFFVFREALPAFHGKRAVAVVELPGTNNDLLFRSHGNLEWLNGTQIVLRPLAGGPVAFELDRDEEKFFVNYDPGITTAQDVVDALANDNLNNTVNAQLAERDSAQGSVRASGPTDAESVNDGGGLISPRAADPPGDAQESALPPVSFDGGEWSLDLVEFFTSTNWRPSSDRPHYGALALMVGTVAVTLLAMLIAVPFGLGAAVYVSEFCKGKTKETLKIVIELLAAVPSVVWGFIGYMVIGPIIIWGTGAPVGVNLLNGGIILALMAVPVIVSVGEDALKAVPDSYREAALSLGATRWQIVYRVLFPAAKNGLLAAVLLGVGRAIGETMAVLMATGHAVQIPKSVLDPIRTLTATIAAELGETVEGDEHYTVLFVIGLVLFASTFLVNLTADLVVKGIRSDKAA